MSSTYSVIPGTLNFAVKRGDRFSALVDFDISLTGYTVTSDIVSLVTGNVVQPVTIAISNATAGVVAISLTETQTAALPVGTYGWRLEWDAPGSVRRTALQGTCEVVG